MKEAVFFELFCLKLGQTVKIIHICAKLIKNKHKICELV